jgi:anti-sigma factor (TIGR02949 family)
MMGDCNETLRELERFLDHELTEPTLAAIQGHLDGCLDCLSAYDFHAELRIVIQEKCRSDEMPPGLLTKIEQCFGADPEGELDHTDGTIPG